MTVPTHPRVAWLIDLKLREFLDATERAGRRGVREVRELADLTEEFLKNLADTGGQGVVLATEPGDDGHLLTSDEVARILRRDPRTVRRYCAKGVLPYVVVGRARLVRREDLFAYIEGARRWA